MGPMNYVKEILRSENVKGEYLISGQTVEKLVLSIAQNFTGQNQRVVSLWNRNNTQIVEIVQYDPTTGHLALGWRVRARTGKRLLHITDSLDRKTNPS